MKKNEWTQNSIAVSRRLASHLHTVGTGCEDTIANYSSLNGLKLNQVLYVALIYVSLRRVQEQCLSILDSSTSAPSYQINS